MERVKGKTRPSQPRSPEPPRFSSLTSCQSVRGIWEKHALWMLAAYARTGDFKHLLAFVRQVHAMRQRSLQRLSANGERR
jgi:hypothetical protein